MLAGSGVQEHKQGHEELLLKGNLSGLLTIITSQDLENLGPQELLEFQIFLSLSENGRAACVLLIKDGILNDFFVDGEAGVGVWLQELVVTLARANDKVHKNTDLVPQALVIFFVTLLHHFVKLRLQTGNSLRVAGQFLNSDLPADLNQIPHGLDCK